MPVHKRIRCFNTRDTYPSRSSTTTSARPSSRAADGLRPWTDRQNLDTSENVAIGDAAGQAEQAMANIKMLLDEAGSRLEHITKITIYLVDPRYREAVYRVVGRWLKGVFPVSTGIVVSALARPEWLVEIDVIAVIPDDAA